MKFTELTEQEFQNFVDTQNNKNFFQTVMMKKKLEDGKKGGKRDAYRLCLCS